MAEPVVKEYNPDIWKQSVREPEKSNGFGGDITNSLFAIFNFDHKFIPDWGKARRQAVLRGLAYKKDNTLVMGAINGLITRFAQTPRELVGGPRLTKHYDRLLREADLGAGETVFYSKMAFDHLTTDNGAFAEIIGPGAPDKPLKSTPTGIAHLDSLRCYVTGDPEFPVMYASHVTGKLHKLHWTRVIRWVDTPSPDPKYRNLGFCALSRVLAVAEIQMMMTRHEIERLDDLPPKGIAMISGVNESQFNDAMQLYQAEKQGQGYEFLDPVAKVFAINPQFPGKVEITPFSTLPEAFNPDVAIKTAVNLVALAIGEDPQEIWPLSGGGLGNGQQSHILHTKGKAKTYGKMLQDFTRIMNSAVLPENMEYKFKPKDTDQDQQDAATAKAWSDVASGLVKDGIFDTQMALELLANTVPQYQDIVLDEAGQIRLPDIDEKPEQPVIVVPEAPQPEAAPEDETTANDQTPIDTEKKAVKTLQSERIDFEDSFEDAFNAFKSGRMNGRRFGVVVRALIARHGPRVFDEGLKEGGVDPADKTDKERQMLRGLVREQSTFVSQLIRNVRQEAITDQPNRAAMWWNKSLMPFYNAALESAAKNASFEWVLGPTEHCTDCKRLSGQVHRFRDWQQRGWLPQADKLECKGFNCKCLLKRTNKRASGRF